VLVTIARGAAGAEESRADPFEVEQAGQNAVDLRHRGPTSVVACLLTE
jgi:hypothetical protein